jgi:hypothetical protein
MQGRAPPRRGARASAAAGGASTSSRASDVNSSLPSHVAAAWEVLVQAAPRLAEVPDASGRLPSAPSLEELVAFQDAAATLSSYAELAASCVELWRDQRAVRTVLLLIVAGSPAHPGMRASVLSDGRSKRSAAHTVKREGLRRFMDFAEVLVRKACTADGCSAAVLKLQRGVLATQLAESYARGAAEAVQRLTDAGELLPYGLWWAYAAVLYRGAKLFRVLVPPFSPAHMAAVAEPALQRSHLADHLSRLAVALTLKPPTVPTPPTRAEPVLVQGSGDILDAAHDALLRILELAVSRGPLEGTVTGPFWQHVSLCAIPVMGLGLAGLCELEGAAPAEPTGWYGLPEGLRTRIGVSRGGWLALTLAVRCGEVFCRKPELRSPLSPLGVAGLSLRIARCGFAEARRRAAEVAGSAAGAPQLVRNPGVHGDLAPHGLGVAVSMLYAVRTRRNGADGPLWLRHYTEALALARALVSSLELVPLAHQRTLSCAAVELLNVNPAGDGGERGSGGRGGRSPARERTAVMPSAV